MSTPRALGPERELPGAAVRHRGPSDTGLSHPGQLVDPTGNQSRARVLWHSWSTPWSHYWSASCPGVLVDPAGYGAGRESSGRAGLPGGPTTRARVALEGWSSTQDLGPGPESPRAAGRHRGPRDTGLSYLGQRVEPAGLRTRARVARDSRSTLRARGHGPELPEMACRPRGPSDTSLNALESCSIPQALEHGPRSHETCGRACGPSELGASPPGQLVDSAGHRTQARLPGRAGQPRGPSDRATRAGGPRRTSDNSPGSAGHLVDLTGPRTLT